MGLDNENLFLKSEKNCIIYKGETPFKEDWRENIKKIEI